jgi:uncharacterized protein (TIGR02246 family)
MKYPADSTTELEICAFLRDYEKKFNEKDAAALAALCTEDAVQVGPEGPIVGRQAIERKYAIFFRESNPVEMICTLDQVHVSGDVSWNFGTWSCSVQEEKGPQRLNGYRLDILLREGDSWKECVSCYNIATTVGANAESDPSVH